MEEYLIDFFYRVGFEFGHVVLGMSRYWGQTESCQRDRCPTGKIPAGHLSMHNPDMFLIDGIQHRDRRLNVVPSMWVADSSRRVLHGLATAQ
jgi:hypothetical protein